MHVQVQEQGKYRIYLIPVAKNYCRLLIYQIRDGETLKRRACGSHFSIRSNSWFSGSKLKIGESLLLTHCWWHQLPQSYCQFILKIAKHTSVDWASFCREVAVDIMITHSEKIGGEGKTVEIDESKFGRSKNIY